MATTTSRITRRSTPHIILGTMTFGGQTNPKDATTMFLDFCTNKEWRKEVKDNIRMIDTAIMYQNGTTEKVIGNILQENKDQLSSTRISIASKANAFTKDKSLSPDGLRQQLEMSLQSLQTTSIDIYYLHAPDTHHDIEPTLEEIQQLYQEKKFQKFGLSNFTAWETMYIYHYMLTHNYVLPTIYQGMYNAITRQIETELLPALQKCHIQFYAYNPLAGGMLTGKYQCISNNEEGEIEEVKIFGDGKRFAGNSHWAKTYRKRFQQKEQFDALEIVRTALEKINNTTDNKEDITMAEASLRWLCHHSQLQEQDGIIIGASSIQHYQKNMTSLSKEPLPNEIVEAFDQAAKLCENVCPEYSRGYSGSALK